MWGKIYGGISMVMGLIVLIGPMLVGDPPAGSDAANVSQTGPMLMGIALCLIGVYYWFRKPRS